jgi:phosphotransferase system HPr-like phosphotransfer protein
MSNRIRVDVRDINTLRNFVSKVSQFDSDVNIIKGSNVFDAKSLFGVIDIAPDLTNTYVEILTKDQDEIIRFNAAMEEFRV